MGRRGLVIFDLDGTLFETARATVPAVEGAFERLGLHPPTRDEICWFIGKPGSDFRAWLRRRSPPGNADELLAVIDELELRFVSERAALYPGAREMLSELRESAEHLAICSNGSDPYVDTVLSSHDIAHFFDHVRYRMSTKDTKPLMVQGLLAHLTGRPAVVVGDRQEDVDAARENGLQAIAATYGYGSPEELSGATAAAKSASELATLVHRIIRG